MIRNNTLNKKVFRTCARDMPQNLHRTEIAAACCPRCCQNLQSILYAQTIDQRCECLTPGSSVYITRLRLFTRLNNLNQDSIKKKQFYFLCAFFKSLFYTFSTLNLHDSPFLLFYTQRDELARPIWMIYLSMFEWVLGLVLVPKGQVNVCRVN